MIELGPITLSMYGFLVGAGILAGFWVACRMADKFEIQNPKLKVSSSDIWDSFWWVIVPGIVGARLYHVIDLWGYYQQNLLLIPAMWTGGMGIFGAIVAGLAGLFVFVRKRGVSFLAMADLVSFGIPLGQAIGRWGNYFNQELYGWPTDMPWGIYIDPEKRMAGMESFTRFHPLFLYESVYSLLVFGFLILMGKRKGGDLPAGMYFSWYLILYGLGRYFLESLRIEPWSLFGINVAQIVSLGMLATGGYIMYSNISKRSYAKH